jgi:hypothetical protein
MVFSNYINQNDMQIWTKYWNDMSNECVLWYVSGEINSNPFF